MSPRSILIYDDDQRRAGRWRDMLSDLPPLRKGMQSRFSLTRLREGNHQSTEAEAVSTPVEEAIRIRGRQSARHCRRCRTRL